MITNILEADVLVIGGGLAGCWAALEAARNGAGTLLVEKGYVGTSGCTTFSAGDILWWTPDDDLEQWIKNYSRWGEHLLDPDWLEMICREVYPLVLEMDAMGIPLRKDEQGKLLRKPGRGHNAAVVVPGYELMMHMRRKTKAFGASILDNVSIVRLAVVDGVLAGAIGVHQKSGELYLIKTGQVILATGGCSWKGNFYGQDMVCGEGYALAYQAGAELSSMEYCNTYNTSHRDFDVYGLSRFQRLGGKFTNGMGERFMPRYDAEFGDGALLHKLTQAMALEIKAGRGPIYFDLIDMTPEDMELSRYMLPMLFRLFARAQVDPFAEKMEWVPGLVGAVACGGGVEIVDYDCRTTVSGLFAVGDTACGTVIVGAAPGLGGINLSWAAVTGQRAGKAAAAQLSKLPEISSSQIEKYARDITRHSAVLEDVKPGDYYYQLQELAIPYEYNLLRSGVRMEEALRKLAIFEETVLPKLKAENGHELVQCFEVEATVLVTRLMFESALRRTETRGFHYREDYPERDNSNWLKRINVVQGAAGAEYSAKEVPVEKYSRWGIEVPV